LLKKGLAKRVSIGKRMEKGDTDQNFWPNEKSSKKEFTSQKEKRKTGR